MLPGRRGHTELYLLAPEFLASLLEECRFARDPREDDSVHMHVVFCDPLYMTNCSLATGRDGMQRIQPTKIMHTTAPGEIDESVAWHLTCTARSTDAMGSRPGGDRDISRNVFWSGGAGSRQTTNTSTGSPKHTCPRPCPGKSPGIKHTQPKSLPRTANTNDCTRPRHI